MCPLMPRPRPPRYVSSSTFVMKVSSSSYVPSNDVPETPKAKMVPLESLLMPARIDEAAPDLGKEVSITLATR